jgi:hypothetical protein
MKGKYKAAIALLLALVLPLALLLTLTHWVPTLAGIWLPAGTRISLHESPRLTRRRCVFPICAIWSATAKSPACQCPLSRPSRWRLHMSELDINSACLSKLPESGRAGAPRTLAEWQSMLPIAG